MPKNDATLFWTRPDTGPELVETVRVWPSFQLDGVAAQLASSGSSGVDVGVGHAATANNSVAMPVDLHAARRALFQAGNLEKSAGLGVWCTR
jgi:hypothetical protein